MPGVRAAWSPCVVAPVSDPEASMQHGRNVLCEPDIGGGWGGGGLGTRGGGGGGGGGGRGGAGRGGGGAGFGGIPDAAIRGCGSAERRPQGRWAWGTGGGCGAEDCFSDEHESASVGDSARPSIRAGMRQVTAFDDPRVTARVRAFGV